MVMGMALSRAASSAAKSCGGAVATEGGGEAVAERVVNAELYNERGKPAIATGGESGDFCFQAGRRLGGEEVHGNRAVAEILAGDDAGGVEDGTAAEAGPAAEDIAFDAGNALSVAAELQADVGQGGFDSSGGRREPGIGYVHAGQTGAVRQNAMAELTGEALAIADAAVLG